MRKSRYQGLCLLLSDEWRVLEKCHGVNHPGLALPARAQLKEAWCERGTRHRER